MCHLYLYEWTDWPPVQLDVGKYTAFIRMMLVVFVGFLQQSLPLQWHCHWRSWKIHYWSAVNPTFTLTKASRGSHSYCKMCETQIHYMALKRKRMGYTPIYFRFTYKPHTVWFQHLTRWEALQVQAGAQQTGLLNDRYWMMADCVMFHSASLVENKA